MNRFTRKIHKSLVVTLCIGAVLTARIGVAQQSSAPPTDIDQRLLEGLNEPSTSRPVPSTRLAGEDLGERSQDGSAVELARRMKAVGERLRRQDLSPETRQMQEAIERDLAAMLEQAEQSSPSAASSSTAGTPGSSSPSPDDAREDAGDERAGSSRGAGTEPTANPLNIVWGNLPERIRQQMRSPVPEEFLPRYERLIKEYYQRLAEEQRRLRQ